jgi:hypothetical protein
MTAAIPSRSAARGLAVVLAAVLALALAGSALATSPADHAKFTREYPPFELSGAAVVDDAGVPGQGDPDGSGQAQIHVTPHPRFETQLIWWIEVEGIAAPTGAHLHAGVAGTNGPIVATLEPFAASEANSLRVEDMTVIQAIVDNPSAFYIDIHTAEFPDGALRGQLPTLGCLLKVSTAAATGPGSEMTLTTDQELWVVGDFLPSSEALFDFRRVDGPVLETVKATTDAVGEFYFVHDFDPGDEGAWLIEGRVEGTECFATAEVQVLAGEGNGPTEPGIGGGGASPPGMPDTATVPDAGVLRVIALLALAVVGSAALVRGGAKEQ